MKQLTLMLIIPEMARADVMLTDDRVYYRFATADSAEDGDLPGLHEKCQLIGNRLLEALKPREGEQKIDDEQLKIKIFVDNVKQDSDNVSPEALARLVTELEAIDDVFAFMRGFIK